MFMNICEVCKEEPQFTTIEVEFPEGMKKINVCMDCAYAIEDLEKPKGSKLETNKTYYTMLFTGSIKHRFAAVIAAISNTLDSQKTNGEKLNLISIIVSSAIMAENGNGQGSNSE